MSLAACEPTKGFMSRAAREPNILLFVLKQDIVGTGQLGSLTYYSLYVL